MIHPLSRGPVDAYLSIEATIQQTPDQGGSAGKSELGEVKVQHRRLPPFIGHWGHPQRRVGVASLLSFPIPGGKMQVAPAFRASAVMQYTERLRGCPKPAKLYPCRKDPYGLSVRLDLNYIVAHWK